jgi:hypothetical protein
MRNVFLILVVIATLSACAVESAEEVPPEETATSNEELYKFTGSADGTPCCAVDYRGGGGVVVCGTRSGEWCCNADETECASCNWYECEPPPEQTSPKTFSPTISGVYGP